MDRHRAGSIAAESDTADPDPDLAALAVVGTDRTAAPPGEAVGDDGSVDESDLDVPLPNAERLIAEAVALTGDDRDLGRLVHQYWRFAPDEDLGGLSPREMVDAARTHRDLAEQRVPGELKLHIGESADGSQSLVQIVTDDMPFLVDSVTSALTAHNLEVHCLVHPLVVVRREPLGRLLRVCADTEPDEAVAGQIVESWMRVAVDRVPDAAGRDELLLMIQQVLTDVREAVEDWPRMRTQALALADELATAHLPVPDRDITDSVELLRWLTDDHFTFLGYREYQLVDGPGGDKLLKAVLGTGLGILRRDQASPTVLSSVNPEAYAKVMEKRLLIITKANSRSTVHRSAYLDYIGFKTFDAEGNVVGEKRFLGLFSSTAYQRSVRELPVVKRKVAAVLERSGLSARSHSGKDLIAILEDYPRDELFQIRTDELYDAVLGVLRLAGRRQLRLFLRKDAYGRFFSCLVFLPRDRFTTANRLKIQNVLVRELNGVGLDYQTRVAESPLARIHVTVRTDPANPPADVDVDAIQQMLADATRNWDDDFRLLLEHKVGDEQARDLFGRYRGALPETYKDSHTPFEAVKDLAKLELLEEPGQLAVHMFRRRKDDRDVRFKVFRYGEPMMLSTVLPVLHSLGVRVSDERPFEIRRADATFYLYDFGLVLPERCRELPEVRHQVENAFSATWRGEAEVDGFNELVIRAGLTWRQVVVLRAYAKYLRQAGTVFAQESMESTFIAYPGIAALLVALFETRFSPALDLDADNRSSQSKELVAAIQRQLDSVASLDQDRILRSYLMLIQATLRTSFFQKGPDGRPKSYVAFKLDPRAIPDLPAPRPRYEIFVYSPRFEGVHLRFGPVARGGLRWSDRRDDFRTEILGLVKAQMVKNAVIVPVGAKGGFVVKNPTVRDVAGVTPAVSDRDAYQAEGVACYKLFISALLDVTDNLVGGEIVPPRDVVRHDSDDAYLVVAADKGTATFSDIANEISLSYGFWLGDAFASGGSAGYDHKKMGITARGAWESVKRHFRELDLDTQSQDFTVVGIGDMSGDVFGNGMLLSEHIRLVAAFDHRHVFVDPDPDPTVSHAERRRLFDLPRSSWADYNPDLISDGGGVWPRTAKSIPVSPQMRAALGIDDDSRTAMSPAELMRAILTAPVDLLFNGGIGTYVKASSESNADVGDKNNDPIRVNATQLRCRVVGEGGNLGLTQRGRIEYAMRGGRISTDFIDNSAGVDTSDHEVNIKILLGGPVTNGEMTLAERDKLLAEMTDEVGRLVLRDNYGQAVALGNARKQAHSLLPVHRRLLADLEKSGRLDRALEAIPTDDELAARGEQGFGLISPEFAVLLAYVKIALEDEINASTLPDDPWTHEVIEAYFPTALREGFVDEMARHPLRREIVTTQVVNETVNRGGTSFVYRAVEETGASAADVIRAYVITREVYGLRDLWGAIEELDNRVPVDLQIFVILEIRRLMDRVVRWLVSNRRSPLDVQAEIGKLRPGVSRLLADLGSLFRGRERDALRARAADLVEAGLPADLAEWATRVTYAFGLIDIVSAANDAGREPVEVAEVYFVLSEHFRADNLLSKISALPREDRWQTLARMALRYDLYAALTALTNEVLESTSGELSAEDRVSQWEQANAVPVSRTREAIDEFDDSPAELAALSVLLRQIRTLVITTAASST